MKMNETSMPIVNQASIEATSPGLPIVSVRAFIEATRDSGYKSTSAAIAELVDNAIEANAEQITISIVETFIAGSRTISISVLDNGSGMPRQVLELALQFGGSTRFGSRKGLGRYGMGLPNGSLSQARRVEVISWERPDEVWMSYLDVDEIVIGKITSIPAPVKLSPEALGVDEASGTLVTLSRCDRLDFKRANKLVSRLKLDLGRLFRCYLVQGGRISINGERLAPVDPTFLMPRGAEPQAKPYGPPSVYGVRVVDPVTGEERTATVKVIFAELPLEAWHGLSNEEKNRRGIAKGAGVAILRAGREIDYGWYFMGSKRRENYDDWWRCEISFPPELDELFGVTHTKQRIRPDERIVALLSPDIERTARELSNRVRRLYAAIRAQEPRDRMLEGFSRKDFLLEPPPARSMRRANAADGSPHMPRTMPPGMSYRIEEIPMESRMFYEPIQKGTGLTLALNENHTFYKKIISRLEQELPNHDLRRCIEMLLVAAARSEVILGGQRERETMKRFRQSWSDSLVAFLT
ncbi:ATP-binding protein [Edaphobacter flagellatus]|uniref:ATP-binding protein n=1 Tax=Edaphobacter flagellatus TaxID=1933044 RepID=UPI0021B1967E|nr:ATP-binding protein [Edaphobacter flagellatus]